MTQLTDHAKTILRAIADGKEFQDNPVCGSMVWLDCKLTRVLFLVGHQDWDMVRIKPETRSINGVEFGCPNKNGRYPLHIIKGTIGTPSECNAWFGFGEAKDRDTAYQAIVDALEGRSK